MIVLNDSGITGNVGRCVCIGCFDGVHAGHRRVIGRTVEIAREKKLSSMVYTFSPFKNVPAITGEDEKTEKIAAMGVDEYYVRQFDENFRNMSPEAFVGELVSKIGARCVVIGEDFTFGKDAAGSADTMRELLADAGAECVVIPAVTMDGQKISSTAIREALAAGDRDRAERMMEGPRGKLLLHVCCGPCSMYPLSVLAPEYGAENITELFYNPNIHPLSEFALRRENAVLAADHFGVDIVLTDDNDMPKWRKYGPETNKLRCMMCYDTRLEYAARYAAEHGFEAFSTTLLVSLWQDHDYIRRRGCELAKEYGIRFEYRDFRVGYRQGQQMAKDIGLYRQKFCGCMWSAPEDKRAEIEAFFEQ